MPRRRVVLGEGHPWFFFQVNGKALTAVGLTTEHQVPEWVKIDTRGLGNWNRIRLIAELLPKKPAKPAKRKKT